MLLCGVVCGVYVFGGVWVLSLGFVVLALGVGVVEGHERFWRGISGTK